MNVVDRNSPIGVDVGEGVAAGVADNGEAANPRVSQERRAASERSAMTRWLMHDIPFIAMLVLAFVGLVFRFPVVYWLMLTPVFAIISIVAGWRHFPTRSDRLRFVASVAAIWCAVLLSIYLLYSAGVQGVLTTNGASLVMMTLLALGTFVAGIQSRVWQICAVGGVLFLAAPGMGWIDQSPLLLLAITFAIIAAGAATWWFIEGGKGRPAAGEIDDWASSNK